ncbi:MAG TPA: UDP-3-O-acyl-N-acetylglucosamine deacetylase [Candidatus Gastranaerophilales bacterium]|nr:UDP-3-O-acyl-N-acetylglucosamine deacetylase [Candidatus Gastranaerophilales bacterium]
MKTIKNTAAIAGKGLMSGLNCNVNIFPSKDGGIKFYVAGAKEPVVVCSQNVVSTNNCVVIGNNENSKVILIEHFMSACAFAGIENLDVCIDSPELPILDGSAFEWHNLFIEAGADLNFVIKETYFDKAVGLSDNKSDITLIPAEDFKLIYCVNFDHPELKNRWVSFDLTQDKKQILEARTFGYLKDLEKFRQAGMALGVTAENAIGLAEKGYTTQLRSEFEPIKHKILDLIGDLYLSGLNPLGFKAHIIAKDAGHKMHTEFARLIKDEIKVLV